MQREGGEVPVRLQRLGAAPAAAVPDLDETCRACRHERQGAGALGAQSDHLGRMLAHGGHGREGAGARVQRGDGAVRHADDNDAGLAPDAVRLGDARDNGAVAEAEAHALHEALGVEVPDTQRGARRRPRPWAGGHEGAAARLAPDGPAAPVAGARAVDEVARRVERRG